MDRSVFITALLCCAALIIAGCTAPAPGAAPEPAATTTAPATAPTPMNAMGCVLADDCVPAQCCHPTGCINRVAAPDCSDTLCTMSCEGPIDCGAGACGCDQGTCTIIPAPATPVETVTPAPPSSSPIRIWATPNRYSPMMSSTPGLELSLITPMEMDSSTMAYDWTASYGYFLSWNPPDYAVNERGASVTTGGGKIYWSFRDKPASMEKPVTITMTARDTATKTEIGRSVLTLDWDGDTAVIVKQIA